MTPIGQALVLYIFNMAATPLTLFLITHFGQAAACTLWEDCAGRTVNVIRYR